MNTAKPILTIIVSCLFGVVTAPAAGEEETIETPRAASVTFTSGRVVRGELTEVTTTEVCLRLREGQVPARYDVSAVRSIRTAGGTYTFNPRRERWEKSLGKAEFGGGRGDKPGVENGKAQTVIADGVGTSKEEALQDAFRSAIRQVTGELLVAKLTVKDDKVLEDKVLTFSAGIIKEGYKELKVKRDGELWRVKVATSVERRTVAKHLIDAGFKVNIKVDGLGLAAEVMTRTEARRKATELIRDTVADLPKVMVAEARKPTAGDYDEDTEQLTIHFQVRADLKKYETYLKHANLVFDKVSLRKESIVYQTNVARDHDLDGGDTSLRSDASNNFMRLGLPTDIKGWYLWVLSSSNANMTSMRWTCYYLDADFKKSCEPILGTPSILIKLLDKDGDEIIQEEFDLSLHGGNIERKIPAIYKWLIRSDTASTLVRSRMNPKGTNIALAPVAMKREILGGVNVKPVKRYAHRLKLSEGDLKRLARVKCEFVMRSMKPASRPLPVQP